VRNTLFFFLFCDKNVGNLNFIFTQIQLITKSTKLKTCSQKLIFIFSMLILLKDLDKSNATAALSGS